MSDPTTKDAPAFDFYPERWLAATADLTDREYRQYMTLLCHAWLRDGLPKNERILKRICGKKVSPKVLEKFAESGDGKLRNSFQESIRKTQRTRIESSREKIRKMNLARLQGAQKEPLQDASTRGPSSAPSPLTTHPIEREREHAREAPCTIEQAREAAKAVMIDPLIAEDWWHDRESKGWTVENHIGTPRRIADKWRSDLVPWCRTVQANRSKFTASPNGQARQPATGRPGVNRNSQPGNLNDPSEYDGL
jgi:uncharacterized protein YdaU (DUF1376 family)